MSLVLWIVVLELLLPAGSPFCEESAKAAITEIPDKASKKSSPVIDGGPLVSNNYNMMMSARLTSLTLTNHNDGIGTTSSHL